LFGIPRRDIAANYYYSLGCRRLQPDSNVLRFRSKRFDQRQCVSVVFPWSRMDPHADSRDSRVACPQLHVLCVLPEPPCRAGYRTTDPTPDSWSSPATAATATAAAHVPTVPVLCRALVPMPPGISLQLTTVLPDAGCWRLLPAAGWHGAAILK